MTEIAASRPSLALRLRRGSLWSVLALLLAGGAYLGIEQLIGNFHTVVAGELYRSAQIDASELPRLKEQYGIATVINLRGPSAKPWYEREVATSRALGIAHVNFPLSAGRELTQAQVEGLIAVMRRAQKPILVHCAGGADRSGIASALYLAGIAKADEEAAEWQMSLFYGHFPFPYFPAWAMDVTWERIEPWLGYPNS